jgi:activator of 2-hydroxyglutaryl-CoA dehydratase
MMIELGDGLRKPWEVKSNLLCAAGTGKLPEQSACRIGISMEGFTGLTRK